MLRLVGAPVVDMGVKTGHRMSHNANGTAALNNNWKALIEKIALILSVTQY